MNGTLKENKKDVFYIIVLILTFVVVLVGATYAIFTYLRSQEEGSSAIYTGTLSIEYLNGRIVSFRNLIPRHEPEYDDETNLYKNSFIVTGTGNLDSLIDINLDLSKNEFSNNTLMYNLYNENKEIVANGYINGTKNINVGKDIILEGGSSKEFTLIIWINENDEDQNSQMGKVLTGTIIVNAYQKIE